jgi:hypothetical protein
VAAFAASAASAAIDRYEGTARPRDGGPVLYRETHWRLPGGDGLSRVVLYRCPDGTPFARKQVWGDPDAIAPRFEFVDGRDGYREGVRAAGTGLEVFWRGGAGEAERRAPVRPDAATVFDAGFDALVRRGWSRLAEGAPVRAAFLLPSRLDTLGVKLEPRGGAPADGLLRLRMTLDAWYGFAAPRTDLSYRRDDRWLLRFEGIGTIRDAAGRHQDVRIDFPPDVRRTGIARAEVDAALARPLARGCDAA